MVGFRNKTIERMHVLASLIPSKFLQKITFQKLLLPFYHTVSDSSLPHVKHLYKIKNVSAFKNDLDFLLKNFDPIDYKSFIQHVSGEKKLRKPSFLLSFDDGLSEVYHTIAPILLEKGIPAIFFLNSAFIDNKDLFFRFKASLLIEELQKKIALEKELESFCTIGKSIQQTILSVNYNNKDILDVMAEKIGCDFKMYLHNNSPYLTNNQISKLIDYGFNFGAHSIDHPEFQYIPYEQQLEQLRESVTFVCNKFGLDYRIFSFPFTDFKVSKQLFLQINTNAITDCTFGCAGLKFDSAPNHYQRIALEVANISAREVINTEYIYFIIKSLLGKQTIIRND